MADLREAMRGQSFASQEEVQTFADKFMARKNREPLKDFQGLSSEQMYHLLHHPFDSHWLLRFPDPLGVTPEAPVMTLASLLVNDMGEKGMKLTQRGNLPRQFCRDAALAFWGEEKYREETRFGGINKEDDFRKLHVTRLACEMAGLLHKDRGRMFLSQQCRDVLANDGLAGLYPKIFKAFVSHFNWAYGDYLPELDFIQVSFGFILYLLQKNGGDWKPNAFYESLYLRAFPALVRNARENSYFSPEDQVRRAFTLRGLIRFAEFMGLAEVPNAGTVISRDGYRVKNLPLLEEVVKFQLPAK